MQAGLDSPEASALKRYVAELPPEDAGAFWRGLVAYNGYMHGTHVAGIAVAGNPFARLLIARVDWDDDEAVPSPITIERAKRYAQSYRDTARYFREQRVRVVNMSWGWRLDILQWVLEVNGIGATPEERAEMASQLLSILREGFHDAIAGSPDILFVCAAGNMNSDVEFDHLVPSSFDLPNMIVVGGVDQAGDPTAFTCTGRNVKLYANGFQVESYLPGGQRMKCSGTSMASPAVVNLAAKLLALRPTLTPSEVIGLIERGAEPREREFSYWLINPKRSVALLREQQ